MRKMAGLRSNSGTPSSPLWRLRRFILPYCPSIGLAAFFLLGKAGMDLLKPWPLKLVLDVVLPRARLEEVSLLLLAGVSAFVIAIAASEGLLNYLGVLHLARAGRTVVRSLRIALFDQIQQLSLQFHHRKATGDLLTRVTSDVKSVGDVITESLAEVVNSVLFIIGMGAVLGWLDWQLTLIVVAGAPLLWLTLLRYSSRIQEQAHAERTREGALASVVHEALATVRLTRAFNREEQERRRFQIQSEASLESGLAATMWEERFSWAVDVLSALITALVLGFGVQRVLVGAITPGTLIVFVGYARTLNKPLRTAINHVNKIAKASTRIGRVVELLDLSEGVTDLPQACDAPRFQGVIVFRDVSFQYETGRMALRGINLRIPAQHRVAIVGPTGAGKSTVTSLIPRLYDPTEGSVLIDSEDVRRYTLKSLRSQISMVFQEAVLLRASIAENIAYGRPSASYEAVVAAAKAANAHDFIMTLPHGYETEVGERGDLLSGGQRQLIAVARALIRDTPIVILDEPLTGLDPGSAAIVMDALEQLMAGKTVVIITHNLAALPRVDQVVVIQGGQIVQQGTHRELVETDGLYREFFRAQRKDIAVADRYNPLRHNSAIHCAEARPYDEHGQD